MEWWPESFVNWILVISGIATTALVLVVWRQFAITKKEMESRLRPWVAPTTLRPTFVIFENHTNEPYESFMIDRKKFPDPELIQYSISIENTGQIPAKKIKQKFTNTKIKFDKNSLEDIEPSKGTFSLIPGGKQTIIFTTPFKEIKKDEIYYVGLSLEYDIDNKNKGKSGKIWKNAKLNHEVLEDWID